MACESYQRTSFLDFELDLGIYLPSTNSDILTLLKNIRNVYFPIFFQFFKVPESTYFGYFLNKNHSSEIAVGKQISSSILSLSLIDI